ncbi:MAG: hypothetical protein CMF49_07175 [Legionellales bacterium]|nr:hypothetical protein [Legionellales bacterium]|tara:strand:+ start:975 stop:1253 length:279 start_codon:yes stop_codon:yes gene_type:complete
MTYQHQSPRNPAIDSPFIVKRAMKWAAIIGVVLFIITFNPFYLIGSFIFFTLLFSVIQAYKYKVKLDGEDVDLSTKPFPNNPANPNIPPYFE